VMFEGARNVERLSSWCRNGLAEFFSAQSKPHQIEERLLQRLSVTKQTAQRIISAWMRDEGDHDGVSDYTRV
jgi:hypothetical protein